MHVHFFVLRHVIDDDHRRNMAGGVRTHKDASLIHFQRIFNKEKKKTHSETRFIISSSDGTEDIATGDAVAEDPSVPAKLSVQFNGKYVSMYM